MRDVKVETVIVQICDIKVPEILLRKAKRGTPKYEEFRGCIKEFGIRVNPLLRDYKGDEPGFKRTLIDGCQRLFSLLDNRREALKKENPDWEPEQIEAEAQKTKLKADYGDYTEQEATHIMLMLNYHRIPNTPTEIADHIKRMVSNDPNLSSKELGIALSMTAEQVDKILRFASKCSKAVMKLLDDGNIKPVTALALSYLPQDRQDTLVQDGVTTLKPKERDEKIDAAITAFKEGRKVTKGQYPGPPKPKFSKKTWAVKCEAAMAAGQVDYHQGLLAACGQSEEDMVNHKRDWEAKQILKAEGSLDEQLAAMDKAREAIVKAKEAVNG